MGPGHGPGFGADGAGTGGGVEVGGSVVGASVDGHLVSGGVRAETTQALRNVATLLAAEGATLADVVKATVFLRHMRDYPILNEVWAEAFGDHRPARSAVAVAELPLHALVEVEVWAKAPGE